MTIMILSFQRKKEEAFGYDQLTCICHNFINQKVSRACQIAFYNFLRYQMNLDSMVIYLQLHYSNSCKGVHRYFFHREEQLVPLLIS